MPNQRFRHSVVRGLRAVTRRLPTLFGFNTYLQWQRQLTPSSDEYLVTDIDGTISMYLRPHEFVDFALFYQDHLYERAEQEVVRRQLRPGVTFVDVGAHIGFYTLLAAKQVGPSGRVLSFEPDPDTCARLRRNVAANPELAGRISVFNAAASDADGDALLHRTSPGNMGGNSLAAAGGEAGVAVRRTTLDRVFADEGIDASQTVVKIDVEGHELSTLRGLRTTLSAPVKPVLLVEAADQHLRRAGDSNTRLVEELMSFNYRLFVIGDDGPSAIGTAPLPSFANLLALPT